MELLKIASAAAYTAFAGAIGTAWLRGLGMPAAVYRAVEIVERLLEDATWQAKRGQGIEATVAAIAAKWLQKWQKSFPRAPV
jgi:hypothetical protein